ncbi:MAG TPA: type II toxin-antitoxin system VapC family toxin [Candidatus Polarisedimenticolaceae bacterium]|nr:type II toxin-antitoxin system VapC family toxin [Candidatus Polarisedimenticolaceae bacterium]
MIAVDTSVVVAAFASWHEGHRAASAVLARHPRVPAQVLIETYSVLTRLPPPHRAPASLVAEFLAERFRSGPITLPASKYRRVIEQAASAGIHGGSVYDAVIAATARHANARLLTRDRRATPTYDRLGVDYELLS